MTLRKWLRRHGAVSFLAYLTAMFAGQWVFHNSGLSWWAVIPPAMITIAVVMYVVAGAVWWFSSDGRKALNRHDVDNETE